jgi:membrane protease subunit HflK
MRKASVPSEVQRLAEPLSRLLDAAWQRMHWWIGLMAVMYALAGITVVRSDEVAVILRWGRLVGDASALQQHGPGLLFAFPRPIDQVVRVPVKHVWETAVHTLTSGQPVSEWTLDPLQQGYAVTGDQNIVQADVVARYRVRDPSDWAFYDVLPEEVLRVEVAASLMRSLGEMGVDRVLADGRKALIATATRRAQQGLDAARSGLELTSLELTSLAPPSTLASDFDAVQSAYIGAETRKKEAEAFAETAIPQAQSETNTAIQTARGDAESALAIAKGESGAFLALDKEYRANPIVVRERMYRDTIERVISRAGSVRWVPPPVGGHYNGFRITIAPSGAGPLVSSVGGTKPCPPVSSDPEDDEAPMVPCK